MLLIFKQNDLFMFEIFLNEAKLGCYDCYGQHGINYINTYWIFHVVFQLKFDSRKYQLNSLKLSLPDFIYTPTLYLYCFPEGFYSLSCIIATHTCILPSTQLTKKNYSIIIFWYLQMGFVELIYAIGKLKERTSVENLFIKMGLKASVGCHFLTNN